MLTLNKLYVDERSSNPTMNLVKYVDNETGEMVVGEDGYNKLFNELLSDSKEKENIYSENISERIVEAGIVETTDIETILKELKHKYDSCENESDIRKYEKQFSVLFKLQEDIWECAENLKEIEEEYSR